MTALAEPLSDLFVGPLHYTDRRAMIDPARIRIYDTTLRDGEQMPGVALSADQKYCIARELSDIGCHIIDLGFPSSSPSERKTLQMVLEGRAAGEIRPDVEILVMCRSSREDIDTTVRTVVSRGFSPADVSMLIFTSASPLHCKYKIGPTLLKREGFQEKDNLPLEFFHDANKRMVREAIAYAKSYGLNVEFGAEDASRTCIESLADLVRTAVAAGATRYVFADTTGSLTPESTAFYCRALTERFPEIERVSHFHNDFDLATVNVIVGLANGFTTLSTTVNGLGERAGNAPLHSVVAALKYLYGIEIPGFRYDKLGRLKTVVERLTGIPVKPHEAVVGFNAYSHESGIHAHGVSISRCMYEPIPFEEVGGTTRFVFGKHSGAHSVFDTLLRHQAEIDVPVDRHFAMLVLQELKAVREAGASTGRVERCINQYYENLKSLGLTEKQLIRLAQELARSVNLSNKRLTTAGRG